jgi:hypothetical protein
MKGALLLFCIAGCTSSAPSLPDLAAPDLAVDKAARCADSFGSALTAPYGRLDGTVLAVVPPGDMNCAMPNSTHLVLQLQSGGAVYRMVVNVQSDQGTDPRVFFGQKSGPAVAWAEGWHPDAKLDYVTTLGAHKSELQPMEMPALVAAVTDRIALDSQVSVFASTSGGASAHLVHRNATDQDGAIVLSPSSAPTYLLFAFADQDF